MVSHNIPDDETVPGRVLSFTPHQSSHSFYDTYHPRHQFSITSNKIHSVAKSEDAKSKGDFCFNLNGKSDFTLIYVHKQVMKFSDLSAQFTNKFYSSCLLVSA